MAASHDVPRAERAARGRHYRHPEHAPSTPCGRLNVGADYTEEEIELIKAVDRFKREQHRPFPTCRDLLAVVLALGYRKTAPREPPPAAA